jgi:dihydroxy-acid dehydratase
MNWTEEDLGKPPVLVDSVYGMGHPGPFHFRELIQATSGMSYYLVSRDIMAAMVEIHALGRPHDGMVLISGNDKSAPAHLVAIACRGGRPHRGQHPRI